jgi:hypothetical protein
MDVTVTSSSAVIVVVAKLIWVEVICCMIVVGRSKTVDTIKSVAVVTIVGVG